jgi:hypothetical protein
MDLDHGWDAFIRAVLGHSGDHKEIETQTGRGQERTCRPSDQSQDDTPHHMTCGFFKIIDFDGNRQE